MVFCLLLSTITMSGRAQSILPDTTKFKHWYSSFDARSASMANANVADRLNSNRMYANPALLPYNTNLSGLAVHSVYHSEKNVLTENVTASLFRSENRRLLLGTTFLSNGPSSSPIGSTDQLSFTELNVDLAYGQMLNSSLSMGFRLNGNYGQTESDNSFTTNASVGFVYAPSSMVSYGLVYKGTGFQNDFFGAGLSYFRPEGAEATQLSTTKLPQRLEIGTTLRFPSLAEHPDFVLSFSNEKLFGESGLVYRGGIEIYVIDKMRLRGGYFHSPIAQGLRVGLGMEFGPVQMDYAYADNNLDLSGHSHLMSISLDF